MTKKDLIKKILELGKELEKADGFDAIMIVNDMEIEVDNYIKQLPIQNVVQQSEQFISLIRELIDVGIIDEDDIEVETWVNNYLKEIN